MRFIHRVYVYILVLGRWSSVGLITRSLAWWEHSSSLTGISFLPQTLTVRVKIYAETDGVRVFHGSLQTVGRSVDDFPLLHALPVKPSVQLCEVFNLLTSRRCLLHSLHHSSIFVITPSITRWHLLSRFLIYFSFSFMPTSLLCPFLNQPLLPSHPSFFPMRGFKVGNYTYK